MSHQRTHLERALDPLAIAPPEGLPPLTEREALPQALQEKVAQSDRTWLAYYAEREGEKWHAFHASPDGEDLVRQAVAYLEGGGHRYRHAFVLAPTGKVACLLRLESGKAWP